MRAAARAAHGTAGLGDVIARALVAALLATMIAAVACGGGKGGARPTVPAASPSAAAAATPTASPTPGACPTPPGEDLGTLRRQQTSTGFAATLTDVQLATDACADTITFTFAGDTLPGYDVRYVQSWAQCGSGEPVQTQGPAQLAITFTPANAHDDAGNSTITTRSFTPAYPSIKEAKLTCDFEAVVSWVFGTELRYFTVTAAPSPARVVVSVWH